MTPAGNAFLIVMGLLSMAGLLTCAVKPRDPSQSRRLRETRRDSSPGGGAKARPELPGEPVMFRTAEARFVNCKASMERRREDMEIYGPQAGRFERQELAYILADQLLASGGIAFREEGKVLRAELRAVIPE